jgi:tRNA pseudouridine55 synthase
MTRRGPDTGPSGICVVDKPAGWTSHDVVARARRELGTRKVGHAGTLDPMATGVLVLGVGRGTRLLTFITGVPKSYEATIRFGVETASLDADGEVTATHDMSGLDPAAVRAGAERLTGDLLQVPPMVSALKVDGRRLHELAREGVEVERRPRPVSVTRFDVEPTPDPLLWTAHVECSSGTYVRSLAADLGQGLGGGAHLAGLRRTAVGPFLLDEAHELDDLVLLPLAEGVRHLQRTVVDDDVAAAVRHGQVLEAGQLGLEAPLRPDSGPWGVLDDSGALLAVYQRRDDHRAKPAIVLAADAG